MATIDFESIERDYIFICRLSIDDEDIFDASHDAWDIACQTIKNEYKIPDDGSMLFYWDANSVYMADTNGRMLEDCDNINEALATKFQEEYGKQLANQRELRK